MIKNQNVIDESITTMEERVDSQIFLFDSKKTEGLKDEIDLLLLEGGLTPSQTHRLKQAKSKLNNVETKGFMDSRLNFLYRAFKKI